VVWAVVWAEAWAVGWAWAALSTTWGVSPLAYRRRRLFSIRRPR